MRGCLGVIIGLGVFVMGAAIWSVLVPTWLIVGAGIALVLWLISIKNAESRRFIREAEEQRRRQRNRGR
jgi:fatty acid desaturase